VLSFAPAVWLYVCTTPVDMRRSFSGLAISVQQLLGHDPVSGHLFVFFNKNADICKALWWASGGFCIFAKRLAKGRFKLPQAPPDGQQYVEMSAADLSLILEGIDISQARRQKRWNPGRKHRLGN
jgi:transposase